MSGKNPVHDFSIERFRLGNLRDFKCVYDLYFETIYTFTYNLAKDAEEAQDITTETFIKLWRLQGNFESLNNIKAFLYITARNACFDYFRKLQRRRSGQKEILYLLRAENESENEAENKMIDAEVFGELSRQIEDLPTSCKKVFKLIYFNNLTTSEIAENMGVSAQNVLNQKARAIRILRSKLLSKVLMPAELCLLAFFFFFSVQ
jgi:RNA polymerase sigma-70 factor (family 1)